ncbi:hypothetical protein [Tabrizicola sp.]|uniref:hypothetical protein n=1 Tax=Tabrizicola sp. TaxID=2005166 RepID=UPI002733E52D|nr:hypothetical protein [Tabrizicola sp.]MDP3195924.1 hypothetical protein [Tabrizicola sp.]
MIKNSRRAVYGCDKRVKLLEAESLTQAQNMLVNTLAKSTMAVARSTYFYLERLMQAYAADWPPL